MWPVLKIAAFVGLIPLSFILWATSQAQFTFQHPRAPEVKVLVSGGGARVAASPAGPAAVSLASDRPQATARLVADERRHDFGYMDPLTRGSHSFLVKNEGDAPLLLEILSTTCQCTVAGVSENQIPPGSEGEVQLRWTVPGHGRVFRQLATVRTNDPENKTISLVIEGLIRTSLGADRDELTMLLDPDKSVTTNVTVFSQLWDDFSIARLDCGIPELTWEEHPAEQQALESLKAKSGRTLRLTVKGDLASTVSDRVTLMIQPRDSSGQALDREDQVQCRLELPLLVTVRRRLSIYGAAIRSEGVIELGEARQGIARQVKMQIKVRDQDVSLPELEFETRPSYLQAEINPHVDHRTGAAVPGLYDFVVTVPADAPACSYLGDVMGQVRIKTAHPRIPDTPLGVRFAVLPR